MDLDAHGSGHTDRDNTKGGHRELLGLSGASMARMIREGRVTSRQAVDAHIAQIERVNPSLNAVVRTRFDEARAEAAEADRRVAAGGPLPPFHGVPCSIKECFALTGMPNTAGLVARTGLVADRDATAVSRLRAAGAIPLGVTNISELCMWMESNNRVYGRTNNPYDTTRTCGGSSGGEGSIIAAAGTPFGLGSDIGGSIRMPAFFNGIFGHKPTGGLVDNSGQFPVPPPGVRTYLTTGPLARRAEDLAPLLRVLAGPDVNALREEPSAVDLAGLTVVTVADNGRIDVDPEIRLAQDRAADALAARGARVRVAHVEGLRHSLEIWSSMLDAANGPSFSSLLGQGTPIRAGRELLRWATGRSPHTFPAIGLALFERIPKLMPARGRRFVEAGRALRRAMEELIGPRGVLLYPPYPTVAPRHGRAIMPPFNWVYTAIFNVLELPVTGVAGVAEPGVLGTPVHVLVGRPHVLATAAEAEGRQAHGLDRAVAGQDHEVGP